MATIMYIILIGLYLGVVKWLFDDAPTTNPWIKLANFAWPVLGLAWLVWMGAMGLYQIVQECLDREYF